MLGRPMLLPGTWACLRVTVTTITAYILLEREEPRESGQFQGLPEAILSYLLPVSYLRNGVCHTPLEHPAVSPVVNILS